METIIFLIMSGFFAKFKSYYVVWKHNNKMYVLVKSPVGFKSYYVVWKRVGLKRISGTGSGLNRTM